MFVVGARRCTLTDVVGFSEPAPLRPGALVSVVAPAGPCDPGEVFRGLAWLRTRYRLRLSPRMFERAGYLAGSDASRSGELERALADDDVDAVFCARGGYGTMRILDAVRFQRLLVRPKWIVGFSDITAVHAVATSLGVASIHGPGILGPLRSHGARERLSLLEALERPEREQTWAGLDVVVPGVARGPVFGGNLTLLASMAAAGRLVVPEGALLLLEDVTEKPYRVDRMLTSLRLGGHFSQVRAIVLGGFTQCDPGPDGTTVEQVLADFGRELGVPMLAGAPFGHGAENRAFVVGRTAVVGGGAVRFLASRDDR